MVWGNVSLYAERRETEMKHEKRAYAIKCPICGREICNCYGESNISIKCGGCKTQFAILRNDNSLTLREVSDLKYGA